MTKFTVTHYHDIREALANGKFPIKVRVTFSPDGKKWVQKYFSTDQSATQEEYTKIKSGSVRGELREVLMSINKKRSEIQAASERASTWQELLSVLKHGYQQEDFISFAYTELDLLEGVIKDKTWTGYHNRLEQLKKYRSVIPFNAIDHDFLTEYKRHLIVDKKRKLNGIYQDFATIKKFYRVAIRKRKATGDPFEAFVLQKESVIKNWHPKDELDKLFDLLECKPLFYAGGATREFIPGRITDAEKNTIRHYLFCCFCGLRFGDKQKFYDINVQGDRIHLKTSKRGKIVIIPLNNKAKELLPYVLSKRLKQSNSRVNEDLENIMDAAGINKHVTFHCARHTFAINAIILGIDLITVRDWLGHTSVTTTEIYAKIAHQYQDESMKKFNSLMS